MEEVVRGGKGLVRAVVEVQTMTRVGDKAVGEVFGIREEGDSVARGSIRASDTLGARGTEGSIQVAVDDVHRTGVGGLGGSGENANQLTSSHGVSVVPVVLLDRRIVSAVGTIESVANGLLERQSKVEGVQVREPRGNRNRGRKKHAGHNLWEVLEEVGAPAGQDHGVKILRVKLCSSHADERTHGVPDVSNPRELLVTNLPISELLRNLMNDLSLKVALDFEKGIGTSGIPGSKAINGKSGISLVGRKASPVVLLGLVSG